MISPRISAPARRRARMGRVASAAIALVVLISGGVVGLAPSAAGPEGHRDVVTAESIGRLNPDVVHSGWRPHSPNSSRRIGHRLIVPGPSDAVAATAGTDGALLADALTHGPRRGPSAVSTRGPPSLVL